MTTGTFHTGAVEHPATTYGHSRLGAPLQVFLPQAGDPEVLVMAAMHGDESETTVALSDAFRSIRPEELRQAVVLCANPDGAALGTRCNAAGVDLNRNFPAANWSSQPVYHKSRKDTPRDIELSPGSRPASEPETNALIELIDELEPRAVVSLHAALACIDDPEASPLGRRLAELTGLPLEADVGYPTPGSFGSWAAERELTVVTYEIEAASAYELKDRHAPVLIELLTGKIPLDEEPCTC